MTDTRDLVAALRKTLDEWDQAAAGSEKEAALEDRLARIEASLTQKAKTGDEQAEDALDDLTDDERELIRAHRAATKPAPQAVEEPEDKPEPKRRTRPGRKKGNAYQWTVDDNGNVQKTDIAHIYSGEDEPDEVEIPEPEEEAA